MGKAVVMASHKGGVGKTTSGVNLAVYLMHCGLRVGMLKADKNPDLIEFAARREEAGLPALPLREAYGNIAGAIEKLRREFDVLIVDTAGHDSVEFRSALTVADVVLSPVRPSAAIEADSIANLSANVYEARRLGNKGLQAHILFARCKTRRNAARIDLMHQLQEQPDMVQPLKNYISELDIFEEAFNAGAGVHEVARASSLSTARAQIELVWQELGVTT